MRSWARCAAGSAGPKSPHDARKRSPGFLGVPLRVPLKGLKGSLKAPFRVPFRCPFKGSFRGYFLQGVGQCRLLMMSKGRSVECCEDVRGILNL